MFGAIGKIFSAVFGGPAKVVGGLFDAGGFLLSAATKGLSDVVVIRLAALVADTLLATGRDCTICEVAGWYRHR